MARENKKELEFTLQVHLAEYESLREEIIQLENLDHQLLNYSLLALGGVLTLAIYKIDFLTQQPILFLAISLIMSAISWAHVELVLSIAHIGKYIRDFLSPRIQKLVGKEKQNEYRVLRWETDSLGFSSRRTIQRIVASGKIAISFISSVFALVAYFYYRPDSNSSCIFQWDFLLLTLAIVAVAVVPIGTLINSFSLNKKFNE